MTEDEKLNDSVNILVWTDQNIYPWVSMNMLHSIEYVDILSYLNHWGQVTHICVSKLTIIGSDNGLSPGRRQAIIWINAGILLIGPLGTDFIEIYI